MFKRKGEAYIDTIITIFLSIVVIYIACSVFSVIYTHQRITDFADKFSEYVSLHGCTSSKQVEDLYEKMIEEYELNPDAIYLSFDGSDYIEDNKNVIGAVQYGGKMVVSLRYVKNVGFLNDVGFIPIPVSVRKVVLSQNYWKDSTYEDTYDNTQIRYLIVKDFEDVFSVESTYSILAGQGVSLNLYCEEDATMPDNISVFAGERELTQDVDYVYEKLSDTTAVFAIASVNSNIIIRAQAKKNTYNISFSMPSSIEISHVGNTVMANKPCYIMFYPAPGNVITNFSVSMAGNDITSTAWTQNSNILYIPNVVGDITVSAETAPATTIQVSVNNAGFVMSLAFENITNTNTTVYWGDGATSQVFGTGKKTLDHIYGLAGEYSISIVFGGSWRAVSYNTNDGMFKTNEAKAKVKLIYLDDKCSGIGQYAFADCSALEYVRILNRVYHIDNYAFSGCSSLERVIINSGTESIGSYAFYNCTSLKDVYISFTDVYVIGTSAFFNLAPNATIYVRYPSPTYEAIQGTYNGTTNLVSNNTWTLPE